MSFMFDSGCLTRKHRIHTRLRTCCSLTPSHGIPQRLYLYGWCYTAPPPIVDASGPPATWYVLVWEEGPTQHQRNNRYVDITCSYKFSLFKDTSRMYARTDSRFASSQWEASLQSNPVSHWLGVIIRDFIHLSLSPHHAIMVLANGTMPTCRNGICYADNMVFDSPRAKGQS